ARFVGFFMFDPTAPDAAPRLTRALSELKLRGVALFPAMHKYRLDDERVDAVFKAAEEHRAAVFAHCGVLTVGVRKKLGLASPFDLRLGDPLSLSAVASRYPRVPVIIPHFGAGFLREALMAADQCPNIHLDTSSSNSWMKYYPGLTLDAVFRQALRVAGADRLLFGTDSSFFPRGWQRQIHQAQLEAMDQAGLDDTARESVLGNNFERLFPPTP
ncbi:MAG TPA: amidohydrolase family protein, partial [Vicinamibacterales bacterium]|nr:amidohydrolase family protein [Vicinamibacterales bacterium]